MVDQDLEALPHLQLCPSYKAGVGLYPAIWHCRGFDSDHTRASHLSKMFPLLKYQRLRLFSLTLNCTD